MSIAPAIEQTVLSEVARSAIQQACARVAPTWPLDQLIAVNPWWEWKDRNFAEVSSTLSAVANVSCLMSKTHYKSKWQTDIAAQHLMAAAKELHVDAEQDELVSYLESDDQPDHWHNLSDWLDSYDERINRMSWQDEITHQISQFSAEFFQNNRSKPADALPDFYQAWLTVARQDKGLEILMAEKGLRKQFELLPNDDESLVKEAIEAFTLSDSHLPEYFSSLLLDVNGWAAWAAYLGWQAQLDNINKPTLVQQLMSVRLAWELVLWRHYQVQRPKAFSQLKSDWLKQLSHAEKILSSHADSQTYLWVWQRAAEMAYQNQLAEKLIDSQEHKEIAMPALQAVFCIDVRSEPMRKALENQHDEIETRGFAGFFGLPLNYQPAGTKLNRPQLPGLLKPAITVTEKVEGNEFARKRQQKLQSDGAFQLLQESPATFSLVEATGLAYAYKTIKNTFFPKAPKHPVNNLSAAQDWTLVQAGNPMSTNEKADLVAKVLVAMGMTERFADTILLVGHGSKTCNNPHAAGLDCGACGGQTGEVNVRVLAAILNDSDVRAALHQHEITIPDTCQFVAALHNTTTDDIECFAELNDTRVKDWLTVASEQARQKRSAKFEHSSSQAGQNKKAFFQQRSQDWSQVRPEWGLANNASFIVAPRSLTKHIDLEGRSFLHDYQWQSDNEFALLELIMTAPMIVTNWINLQYYASVTDNKKYGSGNKVLHNVVGGNLGVFEGNGGDLRIGLPMQSIHDGKQWMHEPLRLSVYIAAPKQAINNIVAKHKMVADLINNDWLYLFQWDVESKTISRLYKNEWHKGAEL